MAKWTTNISPMVALKLRMGEDVPARYYITITDDDDSGLFAMDTNGNIACDLPSTWEPTRGRSSVG